MTRRLASALGLLFALIPATPATASSYEDSLARADSLIVDFRGLEAIAIIDSLLPAARADETRLFGLLSRKGRLLASYGHARSAEPILRQAIAMADARGDKLERCRLLRWLSVAVNAQGRRAEAADLFHKLRNLAAELEDEAHEGWALVGLAWHDFEAGRNYDAISRYEESIALFVAAGEIRGETWSRNGLGTALSGVGDYAGAIASFEAAAAAARAVDDKVIESMALNNLGALAYDLGDPGLAIRQFERARDLQLALNYRMGAFRPALNVALCQLELGRLDEAAGVLEDLLTEARSEGWHNLEAIALMHLGSLDMRCERPRRAAKRFQAVLDAPNQSKLKTGTEARMGLARALVASGDDAGALQILREGRRALAGATDRQLDVSLNLELGRQLLAAGLPGEALERLGFVESEAAGLGLSGYRVEALALAAKAWQAEARPDSALALLRRGARVWDAERGLPLDPEWRERMGSSGRVLYTALAHALLVPRGDQTPAERSRAAFDALQGFKARTLLERMLGPGAGPAAADAVSLERLQTAVLAEGELLLDLYLGDERSLLFAVTREECRAVALPAASALNAPAQSLYGLLSKRPALDADTAGADLAMTAAQALRGQLLGEVEDLIAESGSVILALDGALNLLPASLLDTGSVSCNWLRVPSATVLARLRGGELSAPLASPLRGLALAGLDPDGVQVLPGARREVTALAKRYRDIEARLPGAEDSLPAGPEALRGRGLLHLAAHASVDDQNPWQSSLHLGAAGGHISAAEIARSRLDARLAVLAACSSGGGRLLSGEGVLGLASAFLGAGVPAVVATLWPVDDAASARLSERFYRGLAAGHSVSQALGEARRALREDPATAHPFFWSGYVLVGDGALELPLEERAWLERNGLRLLALFAGLALLLLALRGRGISSASL